MNPNLLIIVEGVSEYKGQYTWWGGNLMAAKDYPVRLDVSDRLVYSTHEYPETIYPQPWFDDLNYPKNLSAVWDKYWGYLIKENIIKTFFFRVMKGTNTPTQTKLIN